MKFLQSSSSQRSSEASVTESLLFSPDPWLCAHLRSSSAALLATADPGLVARTVVSLIDCDMTKKFEIKKYRINQ